MSYYITTFCFGKKFEPIKEKWINRIKNKCKNSIIKIFDQINVDLKFGNNYAWWDVVRLHNNILLSLKTNKPVTHIDMDIIVEKDIELLVNLNYDLIISTEIGNEQAFPKECSSILGFGVCSGFYIIKPSSINFMLNILNLMKTYKNNSYSDQVNIMNYIINNKYTISEEEIIINNIKYKNKIISIDNIKICVLDFKLIIRDPIFNNEQFANHINIDNVGGVDNFLKYFDTNLELLPLTCRCGKKHLGDNNICKHIELRINKINL